jgi:hypothetical protein
MVKDKIFTSANSKIPPFVKTPNQDGRCDFDQIP